MLLQMGQHWEAGPHLQPLTQTSPGMCQAGSFGGVCRCLIDRQHLLVDVYRGRDCAGAEQACEVL